MFLCRDCHLKAAFIVILWCSTIASIFLHRIKSLPTLDSSIALHLPHQDWRLIYWITHQVSSILLLYRLYPIESSHSKLNFSLIKYLRCIEKILDCKLGNSRFSIFLASANSYSNLLVRSKWWTFYFDNSWDSAPEKLFSMNKCMCGSRSV